ncbi:MAG: hypothetical protein SFY66_22755 [Oculatellaceae cyanobacterium bins.114]|nr:hypothetical protein [Oculatellaceae cyanobacterium bins.114]
MCAIDGLADQAAQSFLPFRDKAMSEATNSDHYSAKLDATDSAAPAWFADWADFSTSTVPEPDAQDEGEGEPTTDLADVTPTEEWTDWQTVNFPNAISADAIDRQSLYTDASPTHPPQTASAPSIVLPHWGRSKPTPPVSQAPSPTPISPTPVTPPVIRPALTQPTPIQAPPAQPSADQPNVADLMSLIQELNQCNSALIDRVSQLEDALDRSETALQAEIGRSQEQVLVDPQELATAHEQLAAAHEQVTQLMHQLEFAHQTQQRQQILVETLTTQLENSQERVAQLERDCAALQQQSNEQAIALTQSEHTSRDLYARLHRQQRYTLQYKAALEKCLEVPPPNYESGADSGAAAVFQAGYDLHHLAPQSLLPKVQRIQPWSSPSRSLTGKLEALVNSPLENPLPGLELPHEKSVAGQGVGIGEQETVAAQPLNTTDETVDLTEDEAIESALLNAAVQPLTDLSPEAIQAGLDELQSVIDDFLSGKSDAPSDTEIALWQDLARLIEVSTDDVIKASAAQNFESFTEDASDLTASVMDDLTDSSPLTQVPPDLSQQKIPPAGIPALSQQKIPPATIPAQPAAHLKLPMSAIAAKIAAHANASKDGAMASAQAGGPSPLVYPLRPSKKLSSLAAVDLPTFPRKSEN